MLAKINSGAMVGLEGVVIDVEVDSGRGLASFTLVGLPDAAVKESGERVRSAIRNSGLHFPTNRLTVNLAPADVRKVGPAYDLPIALGLLAASEQISTDALQDALVVGELALDGHVRHVRGILPMTAFARSRGFKRIFVPEVDAGEAALVPGIEVVAVPNLADVAAGLNDVAPLRVVRPDARPALDPSQPPATAFGAATPIVDFQEIKGQETAKRALEVAAAGGHNLLMLCSIPQSFLA